MDTKKAGKIMEEVVKAMNGVGSVLIISADVVGNVFGVHASK